MSKKKNIIRKNVYITLPAETDEYLEKIILDNAFMYNTIRNDFAQEANNHKGNYNMYYDFDPWSFHTEYYNTLELQSHRYDYYCVGLSTQIAENFRTSNASIRAINEKILENKSHEKLREYKYKKFDHNRYSFKINNAPTIKDGRYRGRIKIKSKDEIIFTLRSTFHDKWINREKEVLHIKLKEPIYDEVLESKNPLFIKYYSANSYDNEYSFNLSDIKYITFKYECGNYYIQLLVSVNYSINKKSLKYFKDRVCGIDTGIRHPVTLHDGNNTMYLRMDDKTTRKIHYLERRIRRLEHYRSLKYNANIERTGCKYSNNTIKLTKKIRKLYRKITNIKNFWIQNRCKEIATTYSKICVDRFEQPNHNDEESKKIPKSVMKKINYANRFHKMYYFNEFLKHDCIKYGCEYIESPEDTTRTCSICGYVNDHLPLNNTHLICAKCNNVIERDMNAARNCYDYLIDNT